MAYPGGKGSVFHKIINHMPPHETYIETHLGGGAVMLNKRPAARNIGIDVDTAVMAHWNSKIFKFGNLTIELINGDAVSFLREFSFYGTELVYCDPPYVMSTRRGGKLYDYEYPDDQHRELLEILKALPCKVMLSGYWSDLYGESLEGWNSINFQSMTRGGSMATEYLWMNFPAPVELHDYRYLGDNFRERERIKRKKLRWRSRLERMPALERQALLAAMAEIDRTTPEPARVDMEDSASIKVTMVDEDVAEEQDELCGVYDPSHPWYYKLGGKPLSVEEIEAESNQKPKKSASKRRPERSIAPSSSMMSM